MRVFTSGGSPPVDSIQKVARAIHSHIVVMGPLSRLDLKRMFIGNTAESLLDLLSCDVLIVKPSRFAHRIPTVRRGVRLISPRPVFAQVLAGVQVVFTCKAASSPRY